MVIIIAMNNSRLFMASRNEQKPALQEAKTENLSSTMEDI